MRLRELVSTDQAQNQAAAIRLDDGLAVQAEVLVERFIPTHSAVAILDNVQQAVLPSAPVQKRAMIWHGIYGSGKSHLGVLVGHLLQDGAQTAAFQNFRQRLENLEQTQLARQLDSSFTADSHRYLIVTLYGSGDAPSLQAALLEALYDTLSRHPVLDVDAIMPDTEYDAALSRFQTIIQHQSEWADARLEWWGLAQDYLTTAEMAEGLKRRAHEALETFKRWHKETHHDLAFDPANEGGKNVIEAYREACSKLSAQHGYAGIAVIWDEFGYALEHLMGNVRRNAITEVFELQQFIESLCSLSSAQGHVLFMGLTHRTLSEYGTAARAALDLQQRLETIQGRFGQFRVELKATEQEGYHLLGSLTQLTAQGQQYLRVEQAHLPELIAVCANLSVFAHFKPEHLLQIADFCYPLHPLTAAGLFVIASRGNYSEANRTVFTFFRDLEKQTQGRAFERPVDVKRLYTDELIRLPELLTVYADPIEKEMPAQMDMYRNIVAKIKASQESVEERLDILALLLLGRVLGDNFQPTEAFLAAALYDAASPTAVQVHLDWLKKAHFAYKNERTGVWELETGGSSEVEPLIQDQMWQIGVGVGTYGILEQHTEMREDLLPHLGVHELDPSPAGIVRSYAVSLLNAPLNLKDARIADECLSAQIFLVLPADAAEADKARLLCKQIYTVDGRLIYLWIPRQGTQDIDERLRRYVAIEVLSKQKTSGEGMRRRLQMEWENNRHELIKLLSERFGREGLRTGQAQIFQGGDSDNPVSCKSWHEFREVLAEYIHQLYPQEIPVRAMNVNQLYVEKERKTTRLEHLLHHLLHFDGLPDKERNDLLGEAETSERAAAIDGILGQYANQVFIERAEGWAIKALDELDEPAKSVFQLMRDELSRKRPTPYKVAELRKKLINPPYGIPPAAMPFFAAVALRADYKRLKWVNKDRDFHVVLAEAFTRLSDAQIRRKDFNNNQLRVVQALAKVLPHPWNTEVDEHEAAREVIQVLRTKITNLPGPVKDHAKLTQEARQLVKQATAVGKTAHEMVDFLLGLPGVKEDLRDGLEISQYPQVQQIFRNLLGEFEEIRDQKRNRIRQVLYELPNTPEQLNKLTASLRSHRQEPIAQIIERESSIDEKASALVQAICQKSIDDCDDFDIGKASQTLESAFKTALLPVPEIPVPPVTPPPMPPETKPDEALLIELRRVVASYKGRLDTQDILQAVGSLQNELQHL